MSVFGSLAPILLFALAMGGAGAAFAVGGEEEADEALYVSQVSAATEGDLAPDARIVGEGRPISLDEAIGLSIQNNLDIEVARYEPLISESDRDGAWGAYDPRLAADMGYDVQATPSAIALSGQDPGELNRDRVKGGGIGVDQAIPYIGASFGVRFDASATRTRSDIAAYIDDRFDTRLVFSGTVPLARNLLWNEAWTQVKTSEADYLGSRFDFETAIMDVVQQSANAYWNLVAARDNVRVSQKSLETARALLEQTKTQYEVGVVSRVEVVEAEAGVADREFEVIRTANQYRNAQDDLIDAVLGRELSAMTDLQFAPSDDPGVSVADSVDVRTAVETAFQRRPELQSSRKTIERSEFSLKFAKSQRLPQFDVEMEYGFTGLGGDPNPAPTFGSPAPQVDFDDTTNDFFNQNGADSYSVRGVFSIPFPNTSARKRVVRSELDLRRSKTRLAREEQTIVLEVRRAARTLLASAQGIEAAERRRLAAEEQLRAERIRLEHGESTPFEVLQRESDLVEAESQKIDALQAYRSAEIGLERARGTILDFHSVELDTAAELAP
ncbi:MAG: TolC family protein [bacterium]|nr:TolC family protein [bacterium]